MEMKAGQAHVVDSCRFVELRQDVRTLSSKSGRMPPASSFSKSRFRPLWRKPIINL
jgi:hypothetical protein